MRSCLLTGASSGIGEATATRLIAAGWRVFGTIRSEADASRLEQKLGANFTAIPADVTDTLSLKEAADDVTTQLAGAPLSALVLNSGILLPGPLLYQPLDELDRMWAVNVRGLIASVQAFAPLLKAQTGQGGRMVAMSSVAGSVTYPFMGGYSASKHAVEALCDALRSELVPLGIQMITVAPGPIKTPLWDKSRSGVDQSRYVNTVYAPLLRIMDKAVAARANRGLAADDVAALIERALTVINPQPHYVITPSKWMDWVLPRLLPRRLLDKAIAKTLHIKGPSA